MPTSLTLRQAIHRAQQSIAFVDWRKFRVHYKRKDSFLSGETEQHWTPGDLATQWKLSPETIRRIFADEPGVLRLGNPNPRGRQRRVTIRIPHSVAVRVHRRLSD